MSYQIAKQPNGKYAVWSTVVDDFISVNCGVDDIVEFFVSLERQRIEAEVKRICGELDEGKSPYHQFTNSLSELVEHAREVHGEDTDVVQILDHLGQLEEV